MAAANIGDRKVELTTCSICFETFRVPKYFPCLHSFCEKCVHTYITSTFQKGQTANGVACPVCRAFVKKPDEVNVEDWAGSLPVNHLLVSLIDMNESQNGAKLCNACARENETESAESWCVNCSEALCKQCVRYHRKNKTSTSHKIIDINSAGFSLQSADDFCSDHPDKKLEAYCLDHFVVCCMSCVMLKHRKCDNVGSVESAAQTLKSSDKIANIEKSLIDTRGALETLVQSRLTNMKKNETDLSNIKARVENYFRELANHLDQLKANCFLEITAVEKEVQPDLESQRDELQCKASAVENDLSLLYSHMKYAPPAQFLQAIKKLSEQSAELKNFVRRQKRVLKEIEVRFEGNHKLDEITKTHKIGEVQIARRKLNVGHLGVELDMSKVTLKIVIEKDKGDYVQGLAVVDDDLVLVSKHKGKCLELWDGRCDVISSLSVSGYPYGVKMISDKEGMVAIENSMLTAFKIQNNKIMKKKMTFMFQYTLTSSSTKENTLLEVKIRLSSMTDPINTCVI